MLRNPTEYHLMGTYSVNSFVYPLEVQDPMLIQQQLLEEPFLYAPTQLDYVPFSGPMTVHLPTETIQDYELIQKNHQLLSEKKRRRRESHNAVERRRRENINERIQELGRMLPMMQEEMELGGKSNHKGAILRKCVHHIRNLQDDIVLYQQRIKELELQLASF